MSQTLLGVVLCGGRSSRMGRDKAMLPHPAGGTFADHAIQRLTPLCTNVCVSGGSLDRRLLDRRLLDRHSLAVIQDPIPFQGPVTGIAAALSLARQQGYDACLITPVDMPFLTSKDLAMLCQTWKQESKPCCAVCENEHRLQPLVAIYPASLHASISQLAASQDRSLSRWIENQRFSQVSLPAEACRNINTPEDLSSGPEIPV